MKVKNGEIEFTVTGNGEPVLCIHGVNIADAIVPPFSLYPQIFEKYQFISYYRPGYHGSTSSTGVVSIADAAEHALELLDHLKIEKAHIVAFSFGGCIAFQFLLSHRERVQSAVLLEPYLPREEAAAVEANERAYLQALELYKAGKNLEAAQSYQTTINGPSFLSCVELNCPPDVWERVVAASDTVFGIDLPAYASWDFRMSRADEFGPAPSIPVLAVMGTDSDGVFPGPRETQRFLLKWLPNAERCGLAGATHGMQVMRPVEAAQSTMEFLQRHPIGGTQ